jgi:hypothetical protein
VNQRSASRPVVLALAASLAAAPLAATPWRVDAERSVFAVLTHRAGLGARLAHDHLVVARAPAVTLDFDPARPEAARLAVRVNVVALEVDPTAERAALSARLVELGALAAALPEVDADDRAKVREAMLARGQLAAEEFPEVSAELLSLSAAAAGARGALDGSARVRVTVRGRAVERAVPVRWEVRAGELAAEALAEFRFTEFGIEPYSTLLGAIRNDDRFHLYVALAARPPAEGGAAAGAPPAAAD